MLRTAALVGALLLGLSLVAGGRAAAQNPAEGNLCIACHKGSPDLRLRGPAETIPQDIHYAKGILCQDCHGGNPTSFDLKVAMGKAQGFVGKPTHQAIPQFCGKCHSNAEYMKRFNPSLRVDQVQEYTTSVHGKRLRQGDQKVATCINCHNVHQIKAIKDQQAWTYPLRIVDTCGRCHGDPQYMRGYAIPTDVVAKYKQSVHYHALATDGDLSAPTCNVCHGNHGATPPGVTAVANVCGTCHSVPADLFAKGPHPVAFAARKLPGCVVCHSNHEVQKVNDGMVGTAPPAVCVTCHAPNSDALAKAGKIRAALDGLRGNVERAAEILTRAERAGMEVGQAKFELRGATDALLKARVAVHQVDPATVEALTVAGNKIAIKEYATGVRALDELAFRHRGLWIAVGIILLTITGLVLKIREIDQRPRL